MTLEEIERILRGVADGRTPDEHGQRVLRSVVSLLPVVRAAEEWRERGPGQSHCDEEDCPCTSTVCRLKITVDQMRREMEEK